MPLTIVNLLLSFSRFAFVVQVAEAMEAMAGEELGFPMVAAIESQVEAFGWWRREQVLAPEAE